MVAEPTAGNFSDKLEISFTDKSLRNISIPIEVTVKTDIQTEPALLFLAKYLQDKKFVRI
jgi:hypothetical protein